MFDKFGTIKVGEIFMDKSGARYKKTSNLTFDDVMGMEHYIDPMFNDTVLTAEEAAAYLAKLKTKQEEPEVPKFIADPQSRLLTKNPEAEPEDNGEPEYLVDPQSRRMTKNPKHRKSPKKKSNANPVPTTGEATIIPVDTGE
jgi:hypothetical protein